MKLDRRLTVSGSVLDVTDERVFLSLSEPGRAQFTVQKAAAQVARLSAVALDIGYASSSDSQRLFLGYVDSVTPIDNQHCKLFCRELAAALQVSMPLNLRHPTLRDVLKAMHDKTGLDFSAPAAAYADRKIPHFANIGNGYQAMAGIAKAFRIDDFFYQQQGEGVIYVGSWTDSRWAGKAATVDNSYFAEQLSNTSAKIAAIPAMRPGVELNGNRVTGLEFAGNFMTLSW